MPPPRLPSARFVCRDAKARVPKPVWGLASWSDEGDAYVLCLDASQGEVTTAGDVAAQIPDPATFAERTLVVVLAEPARSGAAWRRLFKSDAAVARPARCSALLMRGYVEIGAGTNADGDLAWGWSRSP